LQRPAVLPGAIADFRETLETGRSWTSPIKKLEKPPFVGLLPIWRARAGRVSGAGFVPSGRSGTSPFLMQVKDFADPDQ
jgi:hypothetical protein